MNFELGVIFESQWERPELFLDEFDPPETEPFCVDRDDKEDHVPALAWAEATWDGKQIKVRARSTNPNRLELIRASLTFTLGKQKNIKLNKNKASMSWTDSRITPLCARFSQGVEVLEVDVLDLRPPSEFAKTPLPEVDPATAKSLREAFLLQRYGGAGVDPDSIPRQGGQRTPSPGTAPPADYSVPVWIEARAAFSVVDKWSVALAEAKNDSSLREQVRMDGEELRIIFAQREDPGAGLVVEEIGWRLKEKS